PARSAPLRTYTTLFLSDLNPSTDTALKTTGDFESPANLTADRQGAVGEEWGYAGRNIFYGIREHAMGSITNGLVYHGGLRAFSADRKSTRLNSSHQIIT